MNSDSANSEPLNELLSLLGETPERPKAEGAHVPGDADRDAETFGRKQRECLSSMEIGELAAGALDDTRGAALLEHVILCNTCSQRLREAKRDLGRELSSEEKSILDGLRSSQAEWQSALVARAKRPGSRRVWNWVGFAAAALVLLGVGGFWLLNRRGPERLLDEAYLEGRPFEYRLDLPGYSGVKQERGAGSSRAQESDTFADAEKTVGALRRKGATDASSLRFIGVMQLLDGHADDAIEPLTQATDRSPNDARLKTDLAVARAVQAQQEQQPSDYGAALNLLAEAIHSDPGNQAAIFDAALVCEQMKQYDEALRYWNQYLELDSKSRWSETARQHLSEIELKKNAGKMR